MGLIDSRPARSYTGSRGTTCLLSGAASVILGLIGALRATPEPPRYFWIAALLCVLLACYRVWHREYESRIAAEHMTATLQASFEEQIAELQQSAKDKAQKDALRATTQLRKAVDDVDHWHLLTNHRFGAEPKIGALLPDDWPEILAIVCECEPEMCAELQKVGPKINHAERLIKQYQAAPQMYRNSPIVQEAHDALGSTLEPLKLANVEMARRAQKKT
jgi:hypothetical protein